MDEDGLLTALPGNRDPQTGQLRVTAFVTARLDPGGDRVDLNEFPLFADWGAVSEKFQLGLEVDSAGPVGTLMLEPDPASPRPNPELWRTLFAKVRVGRGTFQDLTETTVASFPSAAVAGLIRSVYTAVAEQSPTKLPPATNGPLQGLHQIGELLAAQRDHAVDLDPMAGLPHASPPPGSPVNTPGRYVDRSASVPTPTQTIREALRFYDRPGEADPLGPDVVPPEPDRPDLEFHALVSALADYPVLLRHLGLAMDFLVVDGDQLPQGEGKIRFDPLDVPVEWARRLSARPWTHYEITDRRFIARPREREEELVDGSLRVEESRYLHLQQVDLDGAALKLAHTARTVLVQAQVVKDKPGNRTVAPSMTPDSASLPALRGTGLTLYRTGRAGKLVNGFDAASGQEEQRTLGNELHLFAEDVTRGFRVDVAEEQTPDRWRSLHARTGTYGLRTGTPGERVPLPLVQPIEPDEGYLKIASASHNAAEPKVAYVHEAVAGWDGWSLAAPRPGNRIGLTEVEPPEAPEDEPAGFDLPLDVAFRVTPGTLPKLRFGRAYRMRARLVDMSGHSVPEDFLDPTHVTDFTPFFRWDPVPAPAVVPRRPFTEGESLLRMVIRSTLGVPGDVYAQLDRIVALPGHDRDDLAYRAVNERHLAAPIGSQQLAELHGLFDSAVRVSSSPADRDAQFAIAALSAGSFLSPDDAGLLTDGKAPPRPIVLDPQHPNLQGPGEYVLHDVDQLSLPYLPDPLSLAAAFTSLPGDPDTRVLEWPSAGDWFDRRPVRLRVEDGSGPPRWDPEARLLQVFLPQAEHVSVKLSSVLPKDALPLMGIWRWESPASQEAQEEDAVMGRHWLLTPGTTLDLVHAVERPLAPPVIHVAEPPVYNSAVHRFAGETFASLTGTIDVHAKSTGRLDLEATWSEPIDDVTQPRWTEHLGLQAHVADFLLEPNEDACRIARNEYAPQGITPATHLVRHEFGDTKHRWVDYQATATTRFREYFPPEITDPALAGEDLTRHVGPALRLDVPSSQRPDPPQVEYVIPTWTWEERSGIGARSPLGLGFGELATTTVKKRVGGGLRIYLSRPWFSSGADELLGVVVREQPWLTVPRDRFFGSTPKVVNAANFAAEEIIASGLAPERIGSSRFGAAERLLTAPVDARQPVTLSPRTPRTTAQLTSHLAVLDGVGEDAELATTAVRHQSLSAALDALYEAEVRADGIDRDTLTTRWGSDPAWASGPVAKGPYIHQFPLRVAVGTEITLPGQTTLAVVVGHQPAYDEERQLWYCDVQLEAGQSYQPFVDLALVRYQPHSIAKHHASTVVRPGFTQLVPDRTAAVTVLPERSTLAVSVRGPSGYNALGQTFVYGSPPAVLVDYSREVVAQLEQRPLGADDIAWAPLGSAVRLHATGDSLTDISWHAAVPVPEAAEGYERRVVLLEYELFETDVSQAETWVSRPVGGFGEAARKPAGRRLVFAADFAL